MTTFEKHRPGDEFALSIREWEFVCEAARRVLDGELTPDGTIVSTHHAGQVRVWNNGSRALKQFAILAVTNVRYKGRSLAKQVEYAVKDGIEVGGNAPNGSENEILCIVPRGGLPQQACRGIVFGSTCARINVVDTAHRYAKALPGNIDYLESTESGSVRLLAPPERHGLQVCYVLLGFGSPAAITEPVVSAKELFPAVVFRRQTDKPQTFIVCPGGRGTDRNIKTVHVLHVEERKVSTVLFGSLPVAMSNFGATLATDTYGEPVLVCAPGDVEEGSKFPVQRFDFANEEWSKTDTTQSLAGCPAYVQSGYVIVAGGQSAYYVGSCVKLAMSGYGHPATPMWTIDPTSGSLETRTPRRLIPSGFSESVENDAVNREKRFLKQNFSGIPFSRSGNGRSVEFIAIGGKEQLGYQPCAVISYAVDSLGAYVDCENNDARTTEKCELFPDTPLPLGECCAVRIKRRRSGNMIFPGDWLLAVGGRYRDAEGKYRLHERPWSLDLNNTSEGWRDDLFPEIPTPRWNAALSEPVTTPVYDDEGKEIGTEERIFLIGGRDESGLLASIEAYNIDTNTWETEWPGLDGRVPPKKETGENDA